MESFLFCLSSTALKSPFNKWQTWSLHGAAPQPPSRIILNFLSSYGLCDILARDHAVDKLGLCLIAMYIGLEPRPCSDLWHICSSVTEFTEMRRWSVLVLFLLTYMLLPRHERPADRISLLYAFCHSILTHLFNLR